MSDGEVQLMTARADGNKVRVSIVVSGKTHVLRMAKSVAASAIAALALAFSQAD